MIDKRKKIAVYATLVFIVALGLFLRIYNIENTPPGIYPDEAVNGIDAMNALDYGKWQWFYEANNGREGLFMNLIAFCFKLFGISVLTLKLPSIIFGTLAIFGTFLLAKELFRKNYLALISAFLMSISFWAINFSRISFRANMLPFVLTFSFYFIFKGFRTNKTWPFIVGGLFFGTGLHTYIAFRIAPLILFIILIAQIISQENFLRKYWKKLVIFCSFALVAAFPMIYTYLAHPEYLESRSASISILSPEVNKGHLILTFLKSFGLSLEKYNFWGDPNWRHNYPPYPILDPIVGITFLFGFVFSIAKIFQLFWKRFSKKIRNDDLTIYLFLVGWFFIMLAPEFMTFEGNPHSLRSIGTLPVVLIFSALAFNRLAEKFSVKEDLMKKFIQTFIIFALLFSGIFNIIKYHIYWAQNKKTAESFQIANKEISDYIRSLPADKEVFAVLGNMERVPVKLLAWNRKNFKDISPQEINSIIPKNYDDLVIIFEDFEKNNIIDEIQKRFPDLKLKEHRDSFGFAFYTLTTK